MQVSPTAKINAHQNIVPTVESPTINSIIESSMVKTGYDDLTKPKDGLASNFVPIVDKLENLLPK